MNPTEHLLDCLGEEAAEIVVDVSKSLRFGLDDRNCLNPTGPTNRERLVKELNELEAVISILVAGGILPKDWRSEEIQKEKVGRVTRFMAYARERGALHD